MNTTALPWLAATLIEPRDPLWIVAWIGGLFAFFLAVALIAGRRRPRSIVTDVPSPEPWWDEFAEGKKFTPEPDDMETRFRRAYAESDGDHRSYVEWKGRK